MTAIGDLYLIHKCDRCNGQHEEYLLPLDEECEAASVALAMIWVYERALGATDCKLLIAAEVDGRPYAIAIGRTEGGNYVSGWIECLDAREATHITPEAAYALAAAGLPLPVVPAADIADLVRGALARSAADRDRVNRLLEGVNLDGD